VRIQKLKGKMQKGMIAKERFFDRACRSAFTLITPAILFYFRENPKKKSMVRN